MPARDLHNTFRIWAEKSLHDDGLRSVLRHDGESLLELARAADQDRGHPQVRGRGRSLNVRHEWLAERIGRGRRCEHADAGEIRNEVAQKLDALSAEFD